MNLNHKVSINVSRPDNETTEVIRSGSRSIRSRILKFLFGEKIGVFILTPGRTVKTVEICEEQLGGENDVK